MSLPIPSRPERPAILVTRPEPGASATARRLEELGFTPVLAPALEVRIRPDALAGEALPDLQAVLVTSANAIPALDPLRPLPLFAVGDATARAARAAGHQDVTSAGKDAERLLMLVRARLDPAGKPLLLASGEGQGAFLYQGLTQIGFTVLHRFVYCACPVQALPEQAEQALRILMEGASPSAGVPELKAVLFFSPETARSFVRLLDRAGLADGTSRLVACVISSATAEAITSLSWRDIRVAAQPTQDNLLALLR
ncbi:Uroporphyrinogen-III synthase [Granulibacter bethesdensis]|uniref:Uroporphyrinogen-III synthase n=1 Tax=Granulibacter bethesdensis TaxID=364410 RepID=A0AAC9K8M4_9PROT|nr:uroporphyrinogen-III synthase [Granulibacter bethesdensis]APH55756.1 Uroporphyrinogen-III synthase [Granulibacter bethesdensis]APH63341.1 Uroporphyrinogen-III synthase [Granulibacter bethesdensis]